MEWEGLLFDAPNHVPVWFDPRWVRARLRNARRKNHLFYTAWSKIWPGRIFGLFFLPFCRGGGGSTKGRVGCSISVLREGGGVVLLLREGGERDYYYAGRGGGWL